jgi:hypothetical protein
MTKKLFCELIHGNLALQYFGDDITKLGKTTKQFGYCGHIPVNL